MKRDDILLDVIGLLLVMLVAIIFVVLPIIIFQDPQAAARWSRAANGAP